MLDTLWNITMFVISLGLLVTVHEYGHYWVARRNGVMVKRFCVGFGKIVYSRYDKHGTEFALAAIPLGGYVKMLDERIEHVPQELMNESFNSKSVGQRMAIIFAGPAANFIFAVLILWLMFMWGQIAQKPVIGSIDEGSIMEQAGVKAGSEIISVNGKPTLDWVSVSMALAPSIGEETIIIETLNRETKRAKTYTLDIKGKNLDQQNQIIYKTLGLVPYRPKVLNVVADITKGSAAERAGLLKGDEIVKIGELIKPTWPDMVKLIHLSPDVELPLEVKRDGAIEYLKIIPASREYQGKTIGFAGIRPVYESFKEEDLVNIQYGPVEAFTKGVTETYDLIKLSFVMLGKLVTAELSLNNLSGPISIAQGAGQSADMGMAKFLWFLALISVNLGVINLLPLPILDGGHLFYYTIELIRGKSVSERTQQIGFFFGAVVLFALMSIALLNDISRLS